MREAGSMGRKLLREMIDIEEKFGVEKPQNKTATQIFSPQTIGFRKSVQRRTDDNAKNSESDGSNLENPYQDIMQASFDGDKDLDYSTKKEFEQQKDRKTVITKIPNN